MGVPRQRDLHRALIGQAMALPAQLLAPLRSDGALNVSGAFVAGRQRGALMPAKGGVDAAMLRQRRRQGGGDRSGLVQARQQQAFRQRVIARDVVEKGRGRCGAGIAVDERRSERRERMGPAQRDRELHPIAAPRDDERKQADQPARSVPHQDYLDVAAENRRRRQRKVRLIEDVRLRSACRERAPRLDQVGEGAERPALCRQDGLRGRQHGLSVAAGTAPDEDVQSEPALGDDEQEGRFDQQRARGRHRGAGQPEMRNEDKAQHEIDRKG